jgi:glucosamine-phosphate N-acetyltransferase
MATNTPTLDFLFPPSLLPPTSTSTLPSNLIIRPLSSSDFSAGHLAVLSVLTHIGSITEEKWNERFEEMVGCKGTYFIVVIISIQTGKIVGIGTLVVERKLCVFSFLFLCLKWKERGVCRKG